MQDKIPALDCEPVDDRNCLVRLLEHSCEKMLNGLVREVLKVRRQAKMNVYEELQHMVNFYN